MLPGGVPAVFKDYSDVLAYDGTNGASSGTQGTLWTPISDPKTRGVLSPYAKAILSTPGLNAWFRLGKTRVSIGPNWAASPPYFPNYAGATNLRTQGTGTPTLTTGLVPGDYAQACKLPGGAGAAYLDGVDYDVWPSTGEIMSCEIWVMFTASPNDTGIVGQWGGTPNKGWMLYAHTTTIRMYAGTVFLELTNALANNKVFQIVGVWGGEGTPHGDNVSRLYLNGVEVKNGDLTGGNLLQPATFRFQIGQYANGGGTTSLGGIVQDCSVYSRMLQPLEVKQHYNAAFARG